MQEYYASSFPRTNRLARKACRKNRSSYGSICTDPVPDLSFSDDGQTGGPRTTEEPHYPAIQFGCKRITEDFSYGYLPSRFPATRFSEEQMKLPVHLQMCARQYNTPRSRTLHGEDSCLDHNSEEAHLQSDKVTPHERSSYDRLIEQHPRSQGVVEPLYSRASNPRAHNPHGTCPTGSSSRSVEHPHSERPMASQKMAYSESEGIREPPSHSDDFPQQVCHEESHLLPKVDLDRHETFSHPSRDTSGQPSWAMEACGLYNSHIPMHPDKCKKASDDYNGQHPKGETVPGMQVRMQDKASFEAVVDRATRTTKKLIFVQETGQKRHKREKITAGTPSDKPPLRRFSSQANQRIVFIHQS